LGIHGKVADLVHIKGIGRNRKNLKKNLKRYEYKKE
jgi:hypothetical protein